MCNIFFCVARSLGIQAYKYGSDTVTIKFQKVSGQQNHYIPYFYIFFMIYKFDLVFENTRVRIPPDFT